ncbi:MAG: glycoside hydrolase family 2 protein [Phycisphaerae bacterium]
MKEISLNGIWQMCDFSLTIGSDDFKQVKKSRRPWIPTPVPGDVRQGLIAADKIKEPLLGLNSAQDKWIAEKSWWLRKEFNVSSKDIRASEEIELELNGLDVSASIFLNGNFLADHRSAFYPFIRKIKKNLVVGKNILVIRLTHGIEHIDIKAPYSFGGFIPTDKIIGKPECIDPRRVFVRKPQFTWGWDWSPRVPGIGITGNTALRMLKKSAVRDIGVRAAQKGKAVELTVTMTAERLPAYTAGTNQMTLKIIAPNGDTVFKTKQDILLQTGLNYIDHRVTIKKPALWWPIQLGKQNLYTIDIELSDGQERLDSKSIKYGIRFIRLDTENTFAIEINGKKIFCRGANWVPADTVYGRITDDKIKELIRQAKLANFNMFRVWGGGLYEKDCFYETCDKEGILLWHDFMFACSPYPDHIQALCEEVEKEVEYQTSRLKNHACIVLWCGSNECVQCQTLDQNNITESGRVIWGEILPRAVRRNCPDVPYWYCSPYGAGDNYKCDNTDSVGNCHFWRTPGNTAESRIVPEVFDTCTAMFVSEFGHPGPCSKETTLQYLDGAPFDPNDKVWLHHRNSAEGNTISDGIRKYYTEPDKITTDDYLLYGGLHQGCMYEYSLDSLRAKPECNGSLFWMHHDSWGEVGWSIIDYYLRRKIAWYFVKRTFAQIRLILRPADNSIDITLANDSSQTFSATLEYGYVSCDGTFTKSRRRKISVPAGKRLIVADFPQTQFDPSSGIWFARVNGHPEISPAVFRAVPYRNLHITAPHLKWQITSAGKDGYKLKLQADVYVHAVNVSLPSGAVTDDNYFDLLPGQQRTIEIKSLKKLNNQNVFVEVLKSL